MEGMRILVNKVSGLHYKMFGLKSLKMKIGLKENGNNNGVP
jgi:hypothetical protein